MRKFPNTKLIKPELSCLLDCELSNFAVIYPFVYIGNNSKVGEKTVIKTHVTIGDNVMIGDNVKIESYVTIGDNAKIDNNVTINSHSCIKEDVVVNRNVVVNMGGYVNTYIPPNRTWQSTFAADHIIKRRKPLEKPDEKRSKIISKGMATKYILKDGRMILRKKYEAGRSRK